MSDNDQALVKEVLAGDGSAFDRLIQGLEPSLRDYIKGQVRSRPDVAVDDVLQDVRIYLFQRLDRYNPEYPLPVFARGLAKNIVKRHMYRKLDLPLVSDDDEDAYSTDLSPLELQDLPQNFRDTMGEKRFKGPGRASPSRKFLELFEAFITHGGYPHQQISFAFSILIWGKSKAKSSPTRGDILKVPVTGDPIRVVEDIGPGQLEGSCSLMFEDLEDSLGLETEYIQRTRLPMDFRLSLKCKQLLEKDKTSLTNFAKLHETIVGDTLLREYFGKDPRKSVADWTHTVKERVKKAFLAPSYKNPLLPMPEGHENFDPGTVKR